MALPMWWSILPSVANVGRAAGPGRSLATTLPYIGYWSVPLGRRGLPVSQYIGARAWSPGLLSVVTERRIVYLSAIFARFGISSQTSRPGTLVLIGLNSPRYSAGASGFMSNMSVCGGPPPSQTQIRCLALAWRADSGAGAA